MCTYISLSIDVQVKVEPITVWVNVHMQEIDFLHCSYRLRLLSLSLRGATCNISDHTFFFWNCLSMMRKEDHDEKCVMMYVCTHTSLAFVFRLQCALLSLSLSLFFVFEKLRVHKRIICAKDARTSLLLLLLLCLTCSIITPILHLDVCARRKKTNREEERDERCKEIEYWMCMMKMKRRMLRLNVVSLSRYRIRENEDVKKDVFFFFFCLIYTCPSSSNTHSYRHSSQIFGSFS